MKTICSALILATVSLARDLPVMDDFPEMTDTPVEIISDEQAELNYWNGINQRNVYLRNLYLGVF